MLTIPLEKLAFIIVKAREYDAEVPPVDEESGSKPFRRCRIAMSSR